MIRSRLVTIVAVILLALVSATAGYLFAGNEAARTDVSANTPGRRILYWYDPMVPLEHYPGPGKSSMNMDLIPKYAEETDAGIRVSPAMTQNLGIRLAAVQTRDMAPSVRVVGRVELDDRLIAEVQTLTPGFVDSLTVRAVGEPVAQGSLIARVYSPDLLTAQNEYRAVLAMPRGIGSPGLRQAARSRLSLLGLPQGMIRSLERGGAPQRTYPIFARTSGVVTQIGVRPGAQVTPGNSIVTITGISRVLVVAEVPETMLGAVRVGLPVQIDFPAYPGDVRNGRVDYIYPQLNAETRTARVRITLPNPGGRLRGGMFANVSIQGAGGTALAVPSEAVIDTGRRKVVIVRRGGAFQPVEVHTGRELGEWTQILSGIQAGDQVVTSGQFLIDSEASLSGFMDRMAQRNPTAPGR